MHKISKCVICTYIMAVSIIIVSGLYKFLSMHRITTVGALHMHIRMYNRHYNYKNVSSPYSSVQRFTTVSTLHLLSKVWSCSSVECMCHLCSLAVSRVCLNWSVARWAHST